MPPDPSPRVPPRKKLIDRYWRLHGGAAPPHEGQRYAAHHPIRLGVIAGTGMGVLILLLMIGAGALAGNLAWRADVFGAVCLMALFLGATMTGLGLHERRRQKRYGHYDTPEPDVRSGN